MTTVTVNDVVYTVTTVGDEVTVTLSNVSIGAQRLADLTDVDLTGITDGQFLQWDAVGSEFVPVSSSASVAWGAISGTLSSQTDLQTALDGKASSTHIHTVSDITDFDTEVANNSAVAANTAKVTNATHTGDVTGATTLTIANDAVTNAKLANIATARIKGRVTAGTGDPEDLTATQVRSLINVEDGADVTDETNVIAALSGATLTDVGTPASTDRILLQDASDSNNLKYANFSEFGGGVSDHGALTGLADDDHTQYTLADGTRNFSGIVSYATHPTFTADTQLVDKKYVDDSITAGGGYTDEDAQDAVGAMLTGTQTLITVSYDDPNGELDFVVNDDLSLYDNTTSGFVTASSTTTFTNKSGNISQWTNDAGYITATLTEEQVEDIVGGMLAGNTETLITVTYQDADGTIDFVVNDDLSLYDNTTSAFISGITAEPLSDLSDVTITTIADGELLRWNGTGWVNNTLAEAGIAATSHTHTASDITDFDTEVANNSAVTANTAKVTNATHTGDVTGATALTIANDVVTNAKLANVAAATIKGRATAGTGDPEDLTAAQVRTILNVADGATANAGTVTSVAVSGSDGIEVDSGSPITSSGTIALGINAGTLRTHINVEDGADVTDEANVLAALNGATLTDVGTPASTDRILLQDASDSNIVKYATFDEFGGGSGATQLSELSDVNTSTPTNRNVLVADGVDWESRALVEADISDLQSYALASSTVNLTGAQTVAGVKTFSDDMFLDSTTSLIDGATLQIGNTVSGLGYDPANTRILLFVNSDTALYQFRSNGDFRVDGTIRTNASNTGMMQDSATAAAPSYTFNTDDNTGMYRAAADTIGFSTGGTQRLQLANSAATLSVPLAMGSNAITGVTDPVNPQDAATKAYVDANSGGASDLDGLSDVTITTLGADELLFTQDGVTFINQTLAEAGIAAASHTHLLADITDITATATELNYVDGVTSAIQTQLDGKQDQDAFLDDIAALTDPGADRLMFWDDSAGILTWITAGTGLTISGTTITPRAASVSQTGILEIATSAETTTGTDATRAVSPDGLAGSRYGTKSVCIAVHDSATAVTTGDGTIAFVVPEDMDGMNLVRVVSSVDTAGTTGATSVQVRRRRDTTNADMLSTVCSIDSGETRSTTAATAFAINTANDDVAEGDKIYIDVDAVSTTAPQGLSVTLSFRLP